MNYLQQQVSRFLVWSRIGNNIGSKIIDFIHIQAFLTLVSLPILIAWGLPISVLSPLGNLFFSIPLTLFLLLSSLIFFCELLYIPNFLFIFLLDKVTLFWEWAAAGDFKFMMIGFSVPSVLFLIMVPLLACLIIFYKKTHDKRYSCLLLGFLLFSCCVSFKIRDIYQSSIQKPFIHISRNTRNKVGKVSLIKHKNSYILVDPGVIGTTNSAPIWVAYTLIPQIIQDTGTLTIDHVIVLQLNSVLLEALIVLCNTMTIKKMYIPAWKGKLEGKGWHNYKKLRKVLYDNNTELIRLNDKSVVVRDVKEEIVLIKPTGHMISYKNIIYPAFCVDKTVGEIVDRTIDNNFFTIHAAKYTKMKRVS